MSEAFHRAFAVVDSVAISAPPVGDERAWTVRPLTAKPYQQLGGVPGAAAALDRAVLVVFERPRSVVEARRLLELPPDTVLWPTDHVRPIADSHRPDRTRASSAYTLMARTTTPGANVPDLSIMQRYLEPVPTGLGFSSLPGWPDLVCGPEQKIGVIDEGYAAFPGLLHIQRVDGLDAPESRPMAHGTAVLGLLGWADAGTLPLAGGAEVWWTHPYDSRETELVRNLPQAIARMTTVLGSGDVLVIEQQYSDDPALSGVPVEVDAPTALAIRTAVDLGIHVVEPAGNRIIDLDTLPALDNDSGAIVVGCGGSTYINQANAGVWEFGGFGARIDVHAWGEWVVAPTDTDMPLTVPADLYRSGYYAFTESFNSTSSATALVGGIVALAARLARALAPTDHATLVTPAILRELLKGAATANSDLVRPIGSLPDVPALLRAMREFLNTQLTPAFAPGVVPACPVGDSGEIRRLLGAGATDAQIAARIGWTEAQVAAEIAAISPGATRLQLAWLADLAGCT